MRRLSRRSGCDPRRNAASAIVGTVRSTRCGRRRGARPRPAPRRPQSPARTIPSAAIRRRRPDRRGAARRAYRRCAHVKSTSSPDSERTATLDACCSSRPIRCSRSTIPVAATPSVRPGSTRCSPGSTPWRLDRREIGRSRAGRRRRPGPSSSGCTRPRTSTTSSGSAPTAAADSTPTRRVERASWEAALLAAGSGPRGRRRARRAATATARSARCARPAITRCRPRDGLLPAQQRRGRPPPRSRDRGERVLVVDWDAHHGNGTQDIFYADARRLLRLAARVAAVSGHRPARRDRHRRGRRARP